MTSEIEWVKSIAARMVDSGALVQAGGESLRIDTGAKLPYAREVLRHPGKGSPLSGRESEWLLYDRLDERWWTPRVVLECRLSDVTTHDAFSYSARATTDKRAHPYLRYGILLGGREERPGPAGLFGHRNNFDFVACWEEEKASPAEWESFLSVLTEEIQVSRTIQEVLSSGMAR